MKRRASLVLLVVVTLTFISFTGLSDNAASGNSSVSYWQSGRRNNPLPREKKQLPPEQPTTQPAESGQPGQPPASTRPGPRRRSDQVDAQSGDIVKIATQVVNVEAVVYDKKSGRIYSGLKKENFQIFEDGVKQEISNFAATEQPVTMVLLLEYSKLTDQLSGNWWEWGRDEVLRPAIYFVSRFVKPKDWISIVAFDIRPTPIVDFTDDPQRLFAAVNLLLRNNPAFSETNLFDALAFVLRGGVGDAVVLEDSKEEKAEYAGLQEVEGHTAILLVASGIDTFSKINYDQARKIVENSGVPIYVIGTGNLFFKKYEAYLPAEFRMTMLQAQNTLRTFADSTGGKYEAVTFPGEIPTVLESFSAMLRNQYSLAYSPTNTRRQGKRRKIELFVDVDGDGQPDNKRLVVQHRKSYIEPKDGDKKS